MEQRKQHVKMRVPTDAQQTGRDLTARNIIRKTIHVVSAIVCLGGILIAYLSADPLAGQDLIQVGGGVALIGVGIFGLILSEKPREPSVPKRNSYNGDGRKIADNHTRLQAPKKLIL